MGKRGFEAHWVEYCEGEPVEAVEILLKLGHSILNRRKRSKKSKEAYIVNPIGAQPTPPEPAELFERGADGEIEVPF